MSEKPQISDTAKSIRRYQRAAFVVTFLLVGGIAGWGLATTIQGAVIAPGQIVIEGSSKKVQHRDGGIVSEIYVNEGDLVTAGQPLLRLDDTEIRTEMSIVRAVLMESLAAQARLLAIVAEKEEIAFPGELLAESGDPAVAEILEGQENLFLSQIASRQGSKDQLNQRVLQLEEEIRGLESKREQSEIIQGEYDDLLGLYKKKLVPAARVLALQREVVSLKGEIGQLIAEVARAKGRIGETNMQIIQIDETIREESLSQLRELQTRISQLRERRSGIQAQLGRMHLLAPRSGYVHQLAVHTVGGVIGEGETLMLIVPDNDDLVIEARLRPQDITQVHQGQRALVRLPAYDMRKTPQVIGEVVQIAADLKQPEHPNPAYYEARVKLSPEELAKLGTDQPLKPGMPVEIFVQTADRSPASYLVKPLADQIAHVFRER
jgi:HlyD family secretion protein